MTIAHSSLSSFLHFFLPLTFPLITTSISNILLFFSPSPSYLCLFLSLSLSVNFLTLLFLVLSHPATFLFSFRPSFLLLPFSYSLPSFLSSQYSYISSFLKILSHSSFAAYIFQIIRLLENIFLLLKRPKLLLQPHQCHN